MFLYAPAFSTSSPISRLKKGSLGDKLLPFDKVTVRSPVFIPESKAGVVTLPPPAVAFLVVVVVVVVVVVYAAGCACAAISPLSIYLPGICQNGSPSYNYLMLLELFGFDAECSLINCLISLCLCCEGEREPIEHTGGKNGQQEQTPSPTSARLLITIL